MLYRFPVTIESDGGAGDTQSQTIKLVSGTIDKVDIEFPAGCAGLVGVRVRRGLSEVWPTATGAWFVSDDHVITFPEGLKFDERPYELIIEGYNTDDTYNHTISVLISLSPIEAIELSFAQVMEFYLPDDTKDFVSSLPQVKDALLAMRSLLDQRLLPAVEEMLELQKKAERRAFSEMTLEELSGL